jgi:hypothetical protein
LADFIQSAGISKELDEFDSPNAAVAVARQMLEENQHSAVGKNSRVTFIVTKSTKGAKRCEQVTLPSRCESRKVPLDAAFYTEAVVKKVAPMLSVLFAACERKARLAKDVYGNVVEVAPERAADRDKMLGQGTAEARIATAFRSNSLISHAQEARHLLAPRQEAATAKKRAAASKAPATDAKQRKLCFTVT